MHRITVICTHHSSDIYCEADNTDTLSNILDRHGIVVNSACGGRGICGKCTVYINDETAPVKACSYIPHADITVTIPDSSLIKLPASGDDSMPDSFRIINNVTERTTPSSKPDYVCAIDIGSTSISVCITDSSSDITAEDTFYNSTVKEGADVITRLQKASEGGLTKLCSMLRSDITGSIGKLAQKSHIDPDDIKLITIGANSTMQHLLMGLDCSGMCAYPFKTSQTSFPNVRFSDIISRQSVHYDFLKDLNCKVLIIPSFSAFIGGDIISGLFSLRQYAKDNICMPDDPYILLDLGTNAEMVLGASGRLLCTSAAAGPAFEASGISCGVPCVAGAIDNISLRKKNDGSLLINYRTVAGRHPIGICGSGIISLLSELFRLEVIDSYGTIAEDYGDHITVASTPHVNISITQDDIRKLQLAIAAIRTGIELLISHSGLTTTDIKNIFISGSFGSSIDIDHLRTLHILPEEWNSDGQKIFISGNTSLKGALLAALDDNAESSFRDILDRCQELELNNLPEFNDIFLKNINL